MPPAEERTSGGSPPPFPPGLDATPAGPSALTGSDATIEWAVSCQPGRKAARRATVDPRYCRPTFAGSVATGVAMATGAAGIRLGGDPEPGSLFARLAAAVFPDPGRVPESERFGLWVGADDATRRLYANLAAPGGGRHGDLGIAWPAFADPIGAAVIHGLTEARFAAVKVATDADPELCVYVRPVPGGAHRAVGLVAGRCGTDGGLVVDILSSCGLGPALWSGDLTISVAVAQDRLRLGVHLDAGGPRDRAGARRRVELAAGRLVSGGSEGVAEMFADLDSGYGSQWWPSALGIGLVGNEVDRVNAYAPARPLHP